VVRLGLAYSGWLPPLEAVERTARLGFGAAVLWVDLAAGAEALRPALARAGELGAEVLGVNCYANLVHPDAERRAWNVARVREAMGLGLPWVNTMAGTRGTGLSF